MTRLALAAVALAAAVAGCRSSAPYSVPSAALNTGIALGFSAAQRAQGGCYAVCTNGTVCNPKNGLCESPSSDVYCEEAPGGGMRCVPLQIGKEQRKTPEPASGVGVSPATGTVPPPPAEASPRGP
jgi:hypothetical protein